MKQLESGLYTISDTIMGPREDRANGVWGAMVHLGGEPHRRARNHAIAGLFPPLDRVDQTQIASMASAGTAVTVLYLTDTASVLAREGRLTIYREEPFLMKKGSSTRGFPLDRLAPIAVQPGYGQAAVLAGEWEEMAAKVPELVESTFDSIPVYDPAVESRDIHAVYLLTQLGVHGCLFLATDVQPPEDGYDGIVNGYFWVPPGHSHEAESEHGSFLYDELRLRGGRVAGFEPGVLTFAGVLNDALPPSMADAYAMVMDQVAAVPA